MQVKAVRNNAIPKSVIPAALALLLVAVLAQAASGVTLEYAYATAGPQNGYDKYVELSPSVTYTGGLTIPAGDTACIRGNGALIDLQTSTIHVEGNSVWLDIDHCVLINGGDPVYATITEAALNFVASYGSITNNTIYGNTIGVRVYLAGMNAIMVKNNVLMNNAYAGVLCQLGSEPYVIFNDAWGNSGYGDYAMDCGWSGGGIKSWSPFPGTGNISADPLFVDAAGLDFHLNPASPCVGTGDPEGTNIGALGSPTPVESISWGRIKAMFSR